MALAAVALAVVALAVVVFAAAAVAVLLAAVALVVVALVLLVDFAAFVDFAALVLPSAAASSSSAAAFRSVPLGSRVERVRGALEAGFLAVLSASGALIAFALPVASATITIDGLEALACAVLLAAGLITSVGAAGLGVGLFSSQNWTAECRYESLALHQPKGKVIWISKIDRSLGPTQGCQGRS